MTGPGQSKLRLIGAACIAGLWFAVQPAAADELSPEFPKLAIETKAVEIGLAIDPKIAAVPAVFAAMKEDAESAAEAFKKDADADFAERGTSASWNAWFLDRVYEVTFDSDKAISVVTLSLIHISRCRPIERRRYRWSTQQEKKQEAISRSDSTTKISTHSRRRKNHITSDHK